LKNFRIGWIAVYKAETRPEIKPGDENETAPPIIGGLKKRLNLVKDSAEDAVYWTSGETPASTMSLPMIGAALAFSFFSFKLSPASISVIFL